MVNKRVGVRLVAENGQLVKAELEGVGDTGERAFDRIAAKSSLTSKAVIVGLAAMATAATAAATAMIRSGLQVIQSQADVAQSLGTTVESVQALHHAAELAGVATGEAEGGVRRLTRRLSLFAQSGGGPAAKAIEKLHLNASQLLRLPIDQRLLKVNEALDKYATEAERAALLSQLFGDNSWMAFSRLSTETVRKATKDVHDFGVVVSEQDAAKISRTNEALARLGLIWRGIANQLTVAAAPALEWVASAMAAVASRSGPLGQAIKLVFDNLGRLTAYATAFAVYMGSKWVSALGLARLAVGGLSTALVVLRGALIRTGIGALIVGAGELIFWFARLVKAAGGFSAALFLLGEVAVDVWDGIVTSAKAIPVGLQAVWATVRGGFLRLVEGLAKLWADFLHKVAGSMRGISFMEDAALEVYGSAVRAGSAVYELGAAAAKAEGEAASLREEAGRLASEGFDKARSAVGRLADVIRAAEEDSEGALDGTRRAADGVTDALDNVGKAGKKAGEKNKKAAKEAATGWAKTLETLKKYTDDALDLAGNIGDSIVSAFRSAEDAIAEFVKTGKLNFSDMIKSFIADLARLAARKFILGPIANALGGIFNSGGGGFFSKLFTPSYEGGGHTGYGPRVGGLDGKGGYLAMVHPRERIIDETRHNGGRAVGREAAPVYVTIQTQNVESFRQSRTQVAADIQRAVAMGRRGM